MVQKILTVNDIDEALFYLKAEERKRNKPCWKTKSGQVIPIDEMSDTHLKNTINMLEKLKDFKEIVSYGADNQW